MLTVRLPTNRTCRLRPIVLCTAILSITVPGLAAGKNADAPPAVQVNQSIELFLHRIEQRIYANHTMSPPDDSAVDAWMQVIRVIPATDSARVDLALRAFAIRMRSRADEEKKAGNLELSEDLSLFASVAEDQMAHMTAMLDRPEKPPAGEALSDPPKSGQLEEPMVPNNDPVLVAQSNVAPVARPHNRVHRRRFRAQTVALRLGQLY